MSRTTTPVPSKALELITRWEGFRHEPYRDSVGVKTIGYGFTPPLFEMLGRSFPEYVSEAQADTLLRRMLRKKWIPAIEEATAMPLHRWQLAALCSFTWNVGLSAYRQSTMLAKFNDFNEDGGEEEFGRWVRAGGEVLQGLVDRRYDERCVFEKDEQKGFRGVVQPMACAGVEPIPMEDVETQTPTQITVDVTIPESLE